MRFVYSIAVGVMLAVFCGSVCFGDGFSLVGLSPFGGDDNEASREDGSRTQSGISSERPFRPGTRAKDTPSTWEKFQRDMKKFNARTRRFFSDTAEALKPQPPKVPEWLKPRPLFSDSQKKKRSRREREESWFDGLFAPEEPPMPQSPQDFVGMDRPEM